MELIKQDYYFNSNTFIAVVKMCFYMVFKLMSIVPS